MFGFLDEVAACHLGRAYQQYIKHAFLQRLNPINRGDQDWAPLNTQGEAQVNVFL
jgi:hypothetical protein